MMDLMLIISDEDFLFILTFLSLLVVVHHMNVFSYISVIVLNDRCLISWNYTWQYDLLLKYVQENWLTTLRNLVAQINETFSRNFQDMAVAGEVSLGIHYSSFNKIYFLRRLLAYSFDLMFLFFFSDEHDIDFDQFGILIKVKFR